MDIKEPLNNQWFLIYVNYDIIYSMCEVIHMIRHLNTNEYEEAISLIKSVYYATEAVNDTEDGRIEFEREYLNGNAFDYTNPYGYFLNNKLLGIVTINANGFIKYLFVNSRRKGIGTKLLDYVIAIAKDNGLKEIMLDSSIIAHEFYLKNGFKDISSVICDNGMSYIPMKRVI